MTGAVWRSAFVAALFAVHPLHVESVAWVAERKDVLSTLFWMLAMGAYVRYARAAGARPLSARRVLLCLGLMAKPMVVTLPFALLLLDVWPLERLGLGWQRLIAEKLPLLALSAAASLVTLRYRADAASPRSTSCPGASASPTPRSPMRPISASSCCPGTSRSSIRSRSAIPAWQVAAAAAPARRPHRARRLERAAGALAARRLALVPGHAGAGDRPRAGRPAGDRRPLHLSALDRAVRGDRLGDRRAGARTPDDPRRRPRRR